MIHPSYTELIEAINANSEEEFSEAVLNSRYSLVLATSKRARQLIAGDPPLVSNSAGKKPLSIAIDELYRGKVKILPPHSLENLEQEGLIAEHNPGLGKADAAGDGTEDILKEGIIPEETAQAGMEEVFEESMAQDSSAAARTEDFSPEYEAEAEAEDEPDAGLEDLPEE